MKEIDKVSKKCVVCENDFNDSDIFQFLCYGCRDLTCLCGKAATMDWYPSDNGYFWAIRCDDGHELTSAECTFLQFEECGKSLNSEWLALK